MTHTTSVARIKREILVYMPQSLRSRCLEAFNSLDSDVRGLSEIRIREGYPPVFVCHGVEKNSGPALKPVCREEIVGMFNLISANSIHSFEEEIRNGFVTVKGGHRIGMAGKAIVENGKVVSLRAIRSFAVRIARDCPGSADHVLPFVVSDGLPLSTLIVGPPGCGKTTILRELVRLLSSWSVAGVQKPLNVGVVDERSEIAGCHDGIPQNDIGPRVDVLDACPKAEGMGMLIRAMAPDVIVTDEIGTNADTHAILEALGSGVVVFASAHAHSIDSLFQKSAIRRLSNARAFSRIVFLSVRLGPGTVEVVLDQNGDEVIKGPLRSVIGV